MPPIASDLGTLPTAFPPTSIRTRPAFVPDKTRDMRMMEIELGKKIEAILIDLAATTKFDYEIADHLNLLPATLSHWISRLGLREEINRIRKESSRRSKLDK